MSTLTRPTALCYCPLQQHACTVLRESALRNRCVNVPCYRTPLPPRAQEAGRGLLPRPRRPAICHVTHWGVLRYRTLLPYPTTGPRYPPGHRKLDAGSCQYSPRSTRSSASRLTTRAHVHTEEEESAILGRWGRRWGRRWGGGGGADVGSAAVEAALPEPSPDAGTQHPGRRHPWSSSTTFTHPSLILNSLIPYPTPAPAHSHTSSPCGPG